MHVSVVTLTVDKALGIVVGDAAGTTIDELLDDVTFSEVVICDVVVLVIIVDVDVSVGALLIEAVIAGVVFTRRYHQ